MNVLKKKKNHQEAAVFHQEEGNMRSVWHPCWDCGLNS